MNKIIKEALVLMAITLVSGLLLGAVYSITKQPIAQAEEKAQKEAYLAVFPDAQDLTAHRGSRCPGSGRIWHS